jgi:hypothetical protein
MMNALGRYFLLKDWSNTTGDLGSYVFRFGKAIGILGRVLGPLLLIGAIVGSLVSETVLFFVVYGAAFAVMAVVLIELSARLLMIGGNAVSAYGRRSS